MARYSAISKLTPMHTIGCLGNPDGGSVAASTVTRWGHIKSAGTVCIVRLRKWSSRTVCVGCLTYSCRTARKNEKKGEDAHDFDFGHHNGTNEVGTEVQHDQTDRDGNGDKVGSDTRLGKKRRDIGTGAEGMDVKGAMRDSDKIGAEARLGQKDREERRCSAGQKRNLHGSMDGKVHKYLTRDGSEVGEGA
ncbi:hypothetical protein B0H13DRAFT_1861677 [Mycena leptocephala]|nr:hypothetical protein B0H13DRAFT_1861677 [Mycena leptocephala]